MRPRHSPLFLNVSLLSVQRNNVEDYRPSTLLSLRGGYGEVPVTATEVGSSSYASLAWLPRAAGDVASFAIPTVALVLFCFWLELRLRLRLRPKEAQALHKVEDVRKSLREHRHEKKGVLRNMAPRILTLLLTIPWLTGSLSGGSAGAMPWDESFWSVAPSASQFGMWITSATLMVVIDSSMDECAPFSPKVTMALGVLTHLLLVYKLTTATGGGHLSFSIDAMTVLISTLLGGTIDNPAWIFLGTVAVSMLVACTVLGWLPPIPDGVHPHGILVCFVWRLCTSSIYQMLQNASRGKIPQFHLYRDLLSLVAIAGGMPVSWVMKDFFIQLVAFAIKILVDSVALASF